MNKDLIKKISWRLLFVLVGVASTVGFLQLKGKSQFSYGEKGQSPYFSRITEEEAKSLLKNYLDEQEGIWPHYFRLRTVKVKADKVERPVLRGFWLDRKMIEEINQAVDTGATKLDGYNVYLGKWDNANKRHYSLVVRGSRPTGKTTERTGVGPWYDMVDPCPDNCSGN